MRIAMQKVESTRCSVCGAYSDQRSQRAMANEDLEHVLGQPHNGGADALGHDHIRNTSHRGSGTESEPLSLLTLDLFALNDCVGGVSRRRQFVSRRSEGPWPA